MVGFILYHDFLELIYLLDCILVGCYSHYLD